MISVSGELTRSFAAVNDIFNDFPVTVDEDDLSDDSVGRSLPSHWPCFPRGDAVGAAEEDDDVLDLSGTGKSRDTAVDPRLLWNSVGRRPRLTTSLPGLGVTS